MAELPTNIEASYGDRSAGDRVHQQHHDQIHAFVNSAGAPDGVATLDAAGRLPETQVPDRLTEPALSATFAGKVGSDNGADVLAPVRVPVLTTKTVYPNERSTYRPVWGDGDTVYAVGQDRCLRKSTDGGLNWSGKSNSTVDQAFRDCFLVLANGDILTVKNTTPLTIHRSTNDGASFTQVHTLGSGMQPLGSGSWCQDETTGYVYFGEYIGAGGPDVNVYRSTDNGATWTTFYTFPGETAAVADSIKHIHSVSYDPVSQRVYICTGDTQAKAGIYRVTADGTTVEPVILNDQMPANGEHQATAIGLMWFDNYIAWGSDKPGDGKLWRLPRTDLGVANPTAEFVYQLSSEAWWVTKARDDRSMWLLSVAQAVGEAANNLDDSCHLYAVSDEGATVSELGTLGVTNDNAHVQPLGPGGDDFWIGSRAFSGNFAARCEISRGSFSQLFPQAARRPKLVDTWITQNSGSVTVPAGGEVVFGHARVPWALAFLYFKEVGVRVTSGTGILKVRARLAGGATVGNIDTNSTQPAANTRQEAGDFYTVQDLSASSNLIVEFVIYESGGAASATGTAYVVYGFGRAVSDNGGWA